MISMDFIFNGVKSQDMRLYNVRLDTGFVETPWVGSKSVIEDGVPKRDIKYFYGTQKEPLQFTMTFSLLEEKMTYEKKMELARWLFHDEYKELQTTDYIPKSIYVIATNQVNFMTTDDELGYFEIEFQANSPYFWSKTYLETFSCNAGDIIEIKNMSNINQPYKPETEFQLLEGTSFSLVNLSNGGKEFKFTDIQLNETIYVNNDTREIVTDNETYPYRLSNFNKQWIEMTYGVNRFKVNQKCVIQFRNKFPMYF